MRARTHTHTEEEEEEEEKQKPFNHFSSTFIHTSFLGRIQFFIVVSGLFMCAWLSSQSWAHALKKGNEAICSRNAYRRTTNVLGDDFVSCILRFLFCPTKETCFWIFRPADLTRTVVFCFKGIYGVIIITPLSMSNYSTPSRSVPFSCVPRSTVLLKQSNSERYTTENTYKKYTRKTQTERVDTHTRRMPHSLIFMTVALLQR